MFKLKSAKRFYGFFGMLCLCGALAPRCFAAAPANDNFASATPLSGASFTSSGTNVGATAETGEPSHAGATGGTSVWFSWTAPASGTVSMSTFGSDFDTLLAVYTGATVDALTNVNSSDNGISPITTSLLSFSATSGTKYYIAVDGKNGAVGNYTLTSPIVPPANDSFANAVSIDNSKLPNTVDAYNIGATKEINEIVNGIDSGGCSVWFKWIAPVTGKFYAGTFGSDYDTLTGVYTGTSVDALTKVIENDDGNGNLTDKAVFDATSGTTYMIRVEGYAGGTGNIVLTVGSGNASKNIDNGTPIVNPVNGIGVGITSSSGGFVQLGVTLPATLKALSNRDALTVSTSFDGVDGNLSSKTGLTPAQQFASEGAFVATSTATNTTTSSEAGKGRKTIVIAATEVTSVVSGIIDSRSSTAVSFKSVSGKFAFATSTGTAPADQVKFDGFIELPEGFDLTAEHILSVGIGNIVDTVTITPKGAVKDKSKGKLSRIGAVKVKFPKLDKGVTVTPAGKFAEITVTLKTDGMVKKGFDTEGVTPQFTPDETALGVKSVKRDIQLAVVFGGIAWQGTATVDFKLGTVKDNVAAKGSIIGKAAVTLPR